ncbi:UNKNOWN [Stylonychia lemnae]|uniref:Transmembrane protein n=1 Tax=Stylonychia lemnae TaxID=5949 RepID=A0A078B8V7_STYLE|nr:UNKNOWN [Stylonychia lemnae]|eukprot:CDW89727.1 UNKNOWN [Stylonychia lemnae]
MLVILLNLILTLHFTVQKAIKRENLIRSLAYTSASFKKLDDNIWPFKVERIKNLMMNNLASNQYIVFLNIRFYKSPMDYSLVQLILQSNKLSLIMLTSMPLLQCIIQNLKLNCFFSNILAKDLYLSLLYKLQQKMDKVDIILVLSSLLVRMIYPLGKDHN